MTDDDVSSDVCRLRQQQPKKSYSRLQVKKSNFPFLRQKMESITLAVTSYNYIYEEINRKTTVNHDTGTFHFFDNLAFEMGL